MRTMTALGKCLARRSIAAWLRWVEPLSTIQDALSAEA